MENTTVISHKEATWLIFKIPELENHTICNFVIVCCLISEVELFNKENINNSKFSISCTLEIPDFRYKH